MQDICLRHLKTKQVSKEEPIHRVSHFDSFHGIIYVLF